MIQPHSAIARAAYHDLLRSMRDEAASDLRGAPTRVRRGGKTYWYDSYRVGSDVRKAYIGEDSEALRDRLRRAGELKAQRQESQRQRSRLIRILRAEGFGGVDAGAGSLLSAMARAGVFRLGGTIVGTHAFRLYEGELGLRFGFDRTARTNDVDIASFERLSVALEDTGSEPLQQVLADFAFDRAPAAGRGATWRWRQTRSELLVEFLTPSLGESEGVRPLPALGVHAQSLDHLHFLVAEPITAAVTYRSGVLVLIPRPERFAIHELIVADRRKDGPDSVNSVKHRAQAAFLIEALSRDRPDDLAEAHEDALALGPRFRDRIAATLRRMPAARRLLEGIG